MDIRYERAVVKVRIMDKYEDDLEMFGIRDIGPNVKACWIPSEEGKLFQVKWEAKAPARRYKNLDLMAILYLDGKKTDEGILMASDRAKGEYGSLEGWQVKVNRICPFQFGKLKLTTDDLVLGKGKIPIHAANLNTIKVVVNWGSTKLRKLGPHEVRDIIFRSPPERAPVHESSVKNGNLSAAVFGDPVETKASDCTHTCSFKPDTKSPKLPKFTFLFHYAPLEWLRKQGITPPPKGPRPRPIHTPDHIDVDAPDPDIKLEQDTDTRMGNLELPAGLRTSVLGSDEIEHDARDEDVKPEPDTKVGITEQPTTLQATFLDSDEEIELLGFKVPSGAQRVAPVKVEEGVKVKVKVEPGA